MKPGLRIDWSIYTAGCTVERIGQNLQDESLYRRPTAATSVGHRCAGGQNRSTGGGDDPQPDIRGRLQRLLLRVPSRSQPASGARCADGGHPTEAAELGALAANAERHRCELRILAGSPCALLQSARQENCVFSRQRLTWTSAMRKQCPDSSFVKSPANRPRLELNLGDGRGGRE